MIRTGDSVLIQIEVEADYGVKSIPRYVGKVERNGRKERVHFNESDLFKIEEHPSYVALLQEKLMLENQLAELKAKEA